MRTIFFTGKGGTGKSTLASAAAWQISEKGKKVLLVSFDPAHNLGDIFNVSLSHKKKKYSKNLYISELDMERVSGSYLKKNMSIFQEMYSYLKPVNMDKYFKVLKYTPGIEENAALISLEEILKEEQAFDYIIFDTPPTGLTLRILALPMVTLNWIDQLIKIRSLILEKRYTIHNISGKKDAAETKLVYKKEDDMVFRKLQDLRTRYQEMEVVLKGSGNTVVIIFNPDYLSLKESERLLTGLNDLEMPVRLFVNNKVDTGNIEQAKTVEEKFLKKGKNILLKRVPVVAQNKTEGYFIPQDIACWFEKGE